MPCEPLRFIHAANLNLDATLQCTVGLPEEVQREVEDATLTAFQHVVSVCLERKVDFLLLTGNVFIERDRSLRARLALRDGLRQLEDRNVAVFVTPGDLDPPEAWRAIPEMPGNVTVCYPSNPEPVAVMRDGKVIATISNTVFYDEPDQFGIKTTATASDRRPFRIGMLHQTRLAQMQSDSAAAGEGAAGTDNDPDQQEPDSFEKLLASWLQQSLVDYAVLTGHQTRQTIRLKSGQAHCPGRTQPLSPADHAKHGATLVDVDSTGKARCRREPTVAVRWKTFDVDAGPDASAESIEQRCRSTLATEPREKSDTLWLVQWNLTTPHHLVDTFRDVEFQTRFANTIESARTPGEPKYVHSFRLFPAPGELQGENELIAQYDTLAAALEIDDARLQQLVPAGDSANAAWNDRLRALISELDTNMVAAHVRHFGNGWFASMQPGSSEMSED